MADWFYWLYWRLRRWLAIPYILESQKRSSQWRKVRAAHLKTQPVCQACGRSKDLDVHHIVPFHIDPSKELDPDNLITLCGSPCHIVFGHFLSYHCHNENVVAMAAAYRKAFDTRHCSR
jgi:5-methylcytosine-specific restriction endonuclease McrA